MQPEEARALLQESAAIPAPPTRVSVSAATHQGRRIARTRRILAGTAAGVAALAIAGAASAALSPPQRSADIVAGSPASPSAVEATVDATVDATVTEFDPLTRYATVGWLPDGLVHLSTDSSRSGYSVSYHHPPAKGQTVGEPVVTVSAYVAGKAPWQEPPGASRSVENLPFVEAPPVNGQPASWVRPSDAPRSSAWLRWQYRPEAWAEVRVQLRGGQGAEHVAQRIAGDIKMGGKSPILLPFQLSGVPSSLPVSHVQVNQQGDAAMPWEATVGFGGAVSEKRTPPLSVHVFKKPGCACGGKFDERQNTTVQGMPAWRTSTDLTDSITAYSPNKILVEIAAAGRDTLGELGPDGVVRLAEKLTLMGEPENWTAQPLR